MISLLTGSLNPSVTFLVVFFLTSGQPVFGQVAKDSNATPAPVLVVDATSLPESAITQESVESEDKPDLLQADRQREDLTRDRVVSTGIAGGGVLSLLLVIFGYLRLNHATRGFYSRRLQIGAASAVIVIAFVCYFLIAALN